LPRRRKWLPGKPLHREAYIVTNLIGKTFGVIATDISKWNELDGRMAKVIAAWKEPSGYVLTIKARPGPGDRPILVTALAKDLMSKTDMARYSIQ